MTLTILVPVLRLYEFSGGTLAHTEAKLRSAERAMGIHFLFCVVEEVRCSRLINRLYSGSFL